MGVVWWLHINLRNLWMGCLNASSHCVNSVIYNIGLILHILIIWVAIPISIIINYLMLWILLCIWLLRRRSCPTSPLLIIKIIKIIRFLITRIKTICSWHSINITFLYIKCILSFHIVIIFTISIIKLLI